MVLIPTHPKTQASWRGPGMRHPVARQEPDAQVVATSHAENLRVRRVASPRPGRPGRRRSGALASVRASAARSLLSRLEHPARQEGFGDRCGRPNTPTGAPVVSPQQTRPSPDIRFLHQVPLPPHHTPASLVEPPSTSPTAQSHRHKTRYTRPSNISWNKDL